MRSENDFAVWGAGEPGEADAGAVGPVVSTESLHCVEPLDGVGWATVVMAAGSPCRPRWARQRLKRIIVGCRPSLPGARAAIGDGDGCANTSEETPRKSRKVVNRHTWPVWAKKKKSAKVKGSPPETAPSVQGTSPPKPTPRIGEEGVFSPQALMIYIPPSSTGLRLVDPLRSCSVAGSGKRDWRSALPFALPLWYSSV